MHTATWECEEFSVTGSGKYEIGLLPLVADIAISERDPTDWEVERIGLKDFWKNTTNWLSDKEPLFLALHERIQERYSQEITAFARRELSEVA